jgi:hypothetical protein
MQMVGRIMEITVIRAVGPEEMDKVIIHTVTIARAGTIGKKALITQCSVQIT